MSASVAAPAVRSRVRENRGVILALLAIVGFTALTVLAASSTRLGSLDPEATDPEGARALSRLVQDEGVTVHKTTTVRDTLAVLNQNTDATLLVVSAGVQDDPDSQQRLAALLNPAPRAQTVLLAPSPDSLATLAPGVEISGFAPPEVLEPQCSGDLQNRAGNALMGGYRYNAGAAAGTALACYLSDGGASLVTLDRIAARPAVTIFGSAAALTNAHLAENGNAALTMGALGTRPHLVWFLASRTDPDLLATSTPTVTDLIPKWVGLALAQVVIVVLALAWWRGRSLGPVVTEPLPVVVRAAETTEGRARLYRKISARGHAAESLRGASLSRLRSDLHLPPTADLNAVAVAIDARGGRDSASVVRCFDPTPPTSDADLVRLADELDELEQEVRRS